MEMKQVYENANERMHKTIRALNGEYDSIRAGRANASVLDKIQVDYYGVPTPINQMAAISVAEARILTIQPWDLPPCTLLKRRSKPLTSALTRKMMAVCCG